MRPATAEDSVGIAAMIRGRGTWLRERGLPDWGRSADSLAAQAGDPDIPVWVLTRHTVEGERIIGCTTALDETPEWGYTEAERTEPALFLASTVTEPNRSRLGCLIACWALDHAATLGRRWVRRGTFEEPLMRYYRDVQGWALLREVERRGYTGYVMRRQAEPRPDLATAMATGVVALAPRPVG